MTKIQDFDVSTVANFISRMAAYDDLFQKTADSVVLIDTEVFSILDANNACVSKLGEGKEHLLGRIFGDWIAKDMKSDFAAALTSTKDSNKSQNLHVDWQLKNGTRIPMDVTICRLRLSNEMQVIQIIARDVSVETELRRSTDNYLAELKVVNAKLEMLSIKDELTSLSNFRHFHNLLQGQETVAANGNEIYSILFFDLDNFKIYNDLNGHLAGDMLLKTLGEIIRQNCRNSDFPCRYGGEEFAVLCVGTPKDVATKVATRIKNSVENYNFPHRETQPLGFVSVSIGVASFPEDGKDANQVLNAADSAAYESKRNGRNRVTSAFKKAA
jgi:diguanylate cyclase (GGDEF)-like protein/PAS domain S-box-containing protein